MHHKSRKGIIKKFRDFTDIQVKNENMSLTQCRCKTNSQLALLHNHLLTHARLLSTIVLLASHRMGLLILHL